MGGLYRQPPRILGVLMPLGSFYLRLIAGVAFSTVFL
jgi:hypothetical protein